jgi:hypothetical protein
VPFLAILAPLLVLLAGPGSGTGIPLDEKTTSDVCGVCHRDIYRMWEGSVHARSLDNPVFLATYREAQFEGEGDTVRLCLNCHAPMIALNGDESLRQKITWEGVNCDFCHSLVSVDMSGFGPRFQLEVGAVKRGPIENAATIGHEVKYSPLHRSSLACAPCHEYVNAEGTRIMGTYSEWLESGAAEEGRTCQACHMNLTAGEIVDARIERSPQAMINLHEMPGGHSIAQLHEALGVMFGSKRGEETLEVEVTLRNKGAAHDVPTGMPGRRVLLRVEVDAGDDGRFEEQREYGQVFVDAAGAPITRALDYFAKGVRLQSDSRLKAGETRVERLVFPVPPTASARLSIKLHYEHAAKPGDTDRTWITFFSEHRLLRAQPSPSSG